MLIPESGTMAWQFIDVRDLAVWAISLIERRIMGTFNVTGPHCRARASDLMDRIAGAAGGRSAIRRIGTDRLRKAGGERWLELADWADPPEGIRGVYEISIEKAMDAGLRFRPLEQTVRETLASLDHVPTGWPGSKSSIADFLFQEAKILDACL